VAEAAAAAHEAASDVYRGRTKHARLAEVGRNGAGKGCRVWVERV